MSYLGAIHFVLTSENNKVVEASVEPVKELHVEKLICGKKVDEALALLPALFALCPDSQTAAASVACRFAECGEPSQDTLRHARFYNHLEIINEGVRYFALQCADEDYRAAKIQAVIRVREIISQLRKLRVEDRKEREEIWMDLRSQVSFLLLDGFSLNWEQDLFNGTIKPSKDSLTNFFDKISSKRSEGYCCCPLLDKPTPYILNALKEKGCWANGQWNVQVDALTGPVARMSGNPTVRGLLAQDGNTNYTRFVARFIEVLSAADLIRMPLETVAAQDLGEGCAVSLIQNSRGLLLHTAQVKDGVIARYNILTPTEINVVEPAWFLSTLKGLKAESPEVLKALAERTVLSFDPCTQIDVEIKNA